MAKATELKTFRALAIALSAALLFSGAARWPALPSSGFLTGRGAAPEDVDNGTAIFATGQDGKPLDIKIPQYGYFRQEDKYVIILQAEKYDGQSIIGAETFDGEKVVGLLDEFDLLGDHGR
ncbi:hypothetical protein FHT78_000253 [Rhizobium sp. BK196]|jgi:hypothetical protein|uniref:hypothetical protein n=1 Tax=unclassified Rhizobium TaxID=2613769 RepID=UPI00161BF060|nr:MULTISPECIES: hypothetical protein [unclassified Rhizobium]MBB3308524.1 hypothetical protein [Rhizobium sp. BK196]MBB3461371.1 hypothetical protein [Rhizobium sp. BK377]